MGRLGEIIRLASGQGGFVSRAQLVALGMSPGAIAWRVKRGELTHVSDGIYQIFPPTGHLDLMRGAIVALPGAVVSHQSAAHLLELPRTPELVPTVTVASHTTHRFLDVVVHRNDDLTDAHVLTVDGIPTTDPARTIFDLAGVLPYRDFESMADAALVDGRAEMFRLEGLIDELGRRGKIGTRAVRDYVRDRSGFTAGSSRLEIKGRKILAEGGLPAPESEFPIPWSPFRRFDDAYPQAKLAIEWDSRSWHAQQDAMASDRQRDREAAANGWLVVRFTWQDVVNRPDEVVSTVSALLNQRLRSFSGL